MFFTDSRVALAHLGEYKDPSSSNVQAFPLVRLAVGFFAIAEDLGNILRQCRTIQGMHNGRADILSRVVEAGGYKEVMFKEPNRRASL